jgi:large subunit ribosomal protein L21
MYAIVSIAGQQFKVEKNSRIFVHRLKEEEGSTANFDQVLLIDNDGKIQIGEPFVKNAMVTGKVISHLKGDTVKVFKKKRRKGYQKLNGHRQFLTEVVIDDIHESSAPKKAAKAKVAEPEKTEE